MPVYEYRCAACGHAFSKFFRSVNAAGAASCPKCNAPNAERAVSSFAYHQSLKMQLESLDPRYDREIDAAMAPHLADDPLDRVNLDFSRPD